MQTQSLEPGLPGSIFPKRGELYPRGIFNVTLRPPF